MNAIIDRSDSTEEVARLFWEGFHGRSSAHLSPSEVKAWADAPLSVWRGEDITPQSSNDIGPNSVRTDSTPSSQRVKQSDRIDSSGSPDRKANERTTAFKKARQGGRVETGERTRGPNAAAEGSYSVAVRPHPALHTKTQPELLNYLKELDRRARVRRLAERSAPDRSLWLLVHLELNRRGEIAPAFRPGALPKEPKDPDDQEAWETLGRDRQYIDLDWVSCRSPGICPDDPKYHQLIDDGQLNNDLAAQFVCEAWRMDSKADILGLPEFVQLELMSLRDSRIKDRIKYARSEVNRTGRAALIHAAHTGRLKTSDIGFYSDLELASRLAKKEPPARVAELLGLIRGEPAITLKDLKAKRRKLDRWLQRDKQLQSASKTGASPAEHISGTAA